MGNTPKGAELVCDTGKVRVYPKFRSGDHYWVLSLGTNKVQDFPFALEFLRNDTFGQEGEFKFEGGSPGSVCRQLSAALVALVAPEEEMAVVRAKRQNVYAAVRDLLKEKAEEVDLPLTSSVELAPKINLTVLRVHKKHTAMDVTIDVESKEAYQALLARVFLSSRKVMPRDLPDTIVVADKEVGAVTQFAGVQKTSPTWDYEATRTWVPLNTARGERAVSGIKNWLTSGRGKYLLAGLGLAALAGGAYALSKRGTRAPPLPFATASLQESAETPYGSSSPGGQTPLSPPSQSFEGQSPSFEGPSFETPSPPPETGGASPSPFMSPT